METRVQPAASSDWISWIQNGCAQLSHSFFFHMNRGFSFCPKNLRIFILGCAFGCGDVSYQTFSLTLGGSGLCPRFRTGCVFYFALSSCMVCVIPKCLSFCFLPEKAFMLKKREGICSAFPPKISLSAFLETLLCLGILPKAFQQPPLLLCIICCNPPSQMLPSHGMLCPDSFFSCRAPTWS